jgi:hypothetical protein
VTAAIERAACFEPVELDLLATHAGVRFPFPLRVPSFGRFADERDALLASAGHTLCARGLATDDGPVGVADELVRALREYRGAVDLVVVGDGVEIGAVAMVYGERAVVCNQSHDGQAVQVTVVEATALEDELAGLIPAVRAAVTMPVMLPPGVVDSAMRLLADTPDTTDADDVTRRRVRELVRAYGGDEAVVDRLVQLFPAVTGRGQLGVVRRSGGDAVTRPCEVSWLDSARGRVRVDHGDGGWVSVNPLRHSDLVRVLGEIAAIARA